jgi:putative addiction module component (TIGR02574 family)
MTPDILLQEINKLNVVDKMLLLERVWDSLGQSAENVLLPQWQRDELDNRLVEHQQTTDGDILSHEFHQQLRNSL